MIPFNLLIYTYGVTSMTGEGASLKQAMKKCLNIGVISVVFTFMLVIFGLQIPDAVNQAIQHGGGTVNDAGTHALLRGLSDHYAG